MKKIILVGLLVLMCGVANSAQWQNAGTAQLPGTISVSDIDYNTQNYITGPLDRLLAGYRKGMALTYSSASQLTAEAGEVMVANSDASVRLVLRNTSSTTITWSDLDTGSEAASTTYYIYAIAATSAAETATFKISASATAPTGVTYYARLGSFYNNSSSNITLVTSDDQRTFSAQGTVANGGTIPLPTGYAEDQCKWIASPGTHTSRAGVSTPDGLQYMVSMSGRVVTAYAQNINTSASYDITSNYLIVCTE